MSSNSQERFINILSQPLNRCLTYHTIIIYEHETVHLRAFL